jgi:cell division septum initiation protein DivIVA
MTSTYQLQREAELHRQELSSSLDGLRTAATPSYVTTEVLNLAKDSSLAIAKALADQARANPIPALLIGAGLVMMLTRAANAPTRGTDHGPDMFDKTGATLRSAAGAGADAARDTADSIRRTAHDTAHRASDLASDAARRAVGAAAGVSETIGSVGKSASDAARDAVGKAGELGSAALETARTTAEQVRDGTASTASGLMQQGQQTARDLTDRARQASGTTRNYVSTLADEQPIVVAALGAAIGAAIGAALPMTAGERQYLGGASARVKQAGRDTISKVAEVVKTEKLGDDLKSRVGDMTGKVISALSQELSGGKAEERTDGQH